jgi:hypothetical protein
MLRSPIETQFVADLRRLRPELADAYRVALPAARAAVLARLWRGLCIDPLPKITNRHQEDTEIVITLVGGHRLVGPTETWGFRSRHRI